MPCGPSGARSSAPRPILPPTSQVAPAVSRMWPISAVVVDLPLVPVTATKRLFGCARASSSYDEPSRTERSIIRSPQLQGGEAHHREDGGNDPEAEDDGRLGPTLLLEVMVQRRHAED